MFAALFTLGLFAFGASVVAASVYFCERWARDSLAAFKANSDPLIRASVRTHKDTIG